MIKDNSPSIHHREEKSFILLKIEKIVLVCQRLSNFISDSEPAQERLRSAALDLLSHSSPSQSILGYLKQLETICRFIAESKLASPMNFTIVAEECAQLYRYIEGESFSPLLSALVEERPLPVSSFKSSNHPYGPVSDKKDNKRHIKDIKDRPVKTNSNSDRAQKIVAFVQEHGESGIKSISSLFPSVSEKTVQRELTGLVLQGILKKRGERRWSRYLLNN